MAGGRVKKAILAGEGGINVQAIRVFRIIGYANKALINENWHGVCSL